MLNPALDALLKTAQMATPQGTPTVAKGVAQMALEKQVQQAPRMPEVADDLRRAIPTMQQNAQQAQMNQIANIVAQKMSQQGAAPSGIAQFARGGAIGFNGQTESLVPPAPSRIDFDGDVPIYKPGPDKQSGETDIEYRRRKAKEAEEAEGKKPIPRALEWLTQSMFGTPMRVGRGHMGAARPLVPAAQEVAEPTPQNLTLRGKTGSPDTDIGAAAPMKITPEPQKAASKERTSGSVSSASSSRTQAPEAARPSAPTIDPLSAIAAIAGRGAYAKAEPTLQEIEALTQQARASMGLTGKPGEATARTIEEIKEEKQRLADERQKSLKGRPLENLIQSFSAARTGGLSGLGRTYANLQAGQRKDEERFNALQYDRRIAIANMESAREQALEAAAQGNLTRYNAAMDRYGAAKKDYDNTTQQAAIELGKGRLSQEEMANRARIAAEDRASRERIEAAQAKRQGEGQDFARLSGLLSSLERGKQDDLRKVEEAHKKSKEYGLVYTLAGTGATMTPAQQATYDKAQRELANKINAINLAYSNRTGPIEKKLYGAPINSLDLSQWTNFSVSGGG